MQVNNNNQKEQAQNIVFVRRNPRKFTPRILPNILLFENKLKEYIVGQDKAIRRLAIALYRSMKIRTIKTNILIIGSSGSGKTETMKRVAKLLNIPYTIEDATKYTKEGYYGRDVEEMIANLYMNAKGNCEKAEQGMLVIDEIDKKVNNSEFESDVSGTDVLNSMLKMIEGSFVVFDYNEVTQEAMGIDTSQILVVFMGAFDGIDEIRKKRLTRSKIGFSQSNSQSKGELSYTKEDLIQFGMPAEFVGRIDTIIEYEKLSKENLAKIIKNSKLSIFRKYENYLSEDGISLEYNNDIFMKIASKAYNTKTGARELSNIVNQIFEPILFDLFNAKSKKYSKCILEEDFVEKPKEAYKLL